MGCESMKWIDSIATRMGIVGELLLFFLKHKWWWLTPMIFVLMILALLVVFASSSPIGVFIYTLF
jgi:Family of unknown function (DUF5989)